MPDAYDHREIIAAARRREARRGRLLAAGIVLFYGIFFAGIGILGRGSLSAFAYVAAGLCVILGGVILNLEDGP